MKKFSQLLILIVLSFNLSASADEYGLSFQMENQIENRLRELLRTFDSSAQVLVKVTLKTSQATLPGANTEYSGVLGVTEVKNLTQDDIQKVEVKIISKISPVPASVEKSIKQQLSLPESKLTIAFEKMDQEIVSQIKVTNDNGALAEKMESIFAKNREETRLGFYLVFGLGLAFFVLQFLNASRIKNTIEKATHDFQVKLSQKNSDYDFPRPSAQRTLDVLPIAKRPEQLGFQGSSHDNAVTELPITAALALLSDCYWTKTDAYASWLWQQFSATQRIDILKGWDFANDYGQFLSQIPAQPDMHHHHPYYLRPFDLNHVSQDDLALWMQKNPQSWKFISPLRQSSLPISIFQKIEWSAMEKSTSSMSPPSVKSTRRTLSNSSSFGNITELDELKVLENPQIVPLTMRDKVPTLAWLALKTIDDRRLVLETFNAQELAQAWVGHKQILEKLREAMPEAKFKLVESYLKNISPSRNSPVYEALLVRSHTEDKSEIKAA